MSDYRGRYVLHKSLPDALEHLQLWFADEEWRRPCSSVVRWRAKQSWLLGKIEKRGGPILTKSLTKSDRVAIVKQMAEVGVHEAKTHLSRLLRRCASGEEIVILRSGQPVARLVPFGPPGGRELGFDAGLFTVPDDFNDPLPADVYDLFEQ